MAGRLPSADKVPATVENLRELAFAYLPRLRFDADERFFPVSPEAYLSHTGAAPWPEDAWSEPDDVLPDPRRRGTALCIVDPATGLTRQAGAPNVHGRPLNPADLAASPTDGGAPLPFLCFAGWEPDSARGRGDADYLAAAFSEFAAAMNPALRWIPFDESTQPGTGTRPPTLPQLWVPQPPAPTIWAEVEWFGHYRGLLAEDPGDGTWLDPSDARNDHYLCLTYYVFYAAREPSGSGDATRACEGQWEAATLFFETAGADGTERPVTADVTVLEPPVWASVTQGRDLQGRYLAETRRWSDTERTPHPTAVEIADRGSAVLPLDVERAPSTELVLYVGRGSHRFHFERLRDSPWPPPGELEDIDWEDISGPGFPGYDPFAVAGEIGWALEDEISPDDPDTFWEDVWSFFASILVGIVILLALLVALLAWPFYALADLFDSTTGDDLPRGGREEARGDLTEAAGESYLPEEDERQDGALGSQSGHASAPFALTLVDRLNAPDDHPAWWNYSGRWGIEVSGADGTWQSGTQRVDRADRSLGYFTAYWLEDHVADG